MSSFNTSKKEEDREFYRWSALSDFNIDNNKKIPNLLSPKYKIS